jgi:hypothetical protein
MAHPKQQPKPKEMFQPYDAVAVPDIMPFPELALVATTKGQETAVPKLNQHQQSWILDITLHTVDLGSLSSKKAATEFYDKVKTEAFDAKAFQHKMQPGDREEEAGLPALVATWKRQDQRKKIARKTKSGGDDGAASEDEQEEKGDAESHQ